MMNSKESYFLFWYKCVVHILISFIGCDQQLEKFDIKFLENSHTESCFTTHNTYTHTNY